MYNGKKFLAIIPARSGSKGLKNKNIKEINGKPMIAYTIEAALQSGIFEDIVVSTDSKDYAQIAEKYGASVPFLRPENLATDKSSSTDVIIHMMKELEREGFTYDYFMLLQPTSPLRNSDDILNAVKLLFQKDANSIVSVSEAEHSPLLMNTLDETLCMDNFLSSDYNKRRQELPTYYKLNGSIYLCNTKYFIQFKDFYKEKSFAYVMSQRNSVDVDSIIDFELAKVLLTSSEKG